MGFKNSNPGCNCCGFDGVVVCAPLNPTASRATNILNVPGSSFSLAPGYWITSPDTVIYALGTGQCIYPGGGDLDYDQGAGLIFFAIENNYTAALTGQVWSVTDAGASPTKLVDDSVNLAANALSGANAFAISRPIAVDRINQNVYFGSQVKYGTGGSTTASLSIWRCSYTGSGGAPSIIWDSGAVSATGWALTGIAVDAANDLVFFCVESFTGSAASRWIYSSTLSGGSPTALLTDINNAYNVLFGDIDVSPSLGQVFFASNTNYPGSSGSHTPGVYTMTYGGSGLTKLVCAGLISGAITPNYNALNGLFSSGLSMPLCVNDAQGSLFVGSIDTFNTGCYVSRYNLSGTSGSGAGVQSPALSSGQFGQDNVFGITPGKN